MKPPKLVDAPQTHKDVFVGEGTSKSTPEPVTVATEHKAGKGRVVRSDGTEARRLVVYLPPETMQRLRMHCAENELSLSAAASEAFAEWLGS